MKNLCGKAARGVSGVGTEGQGRGDQERWYLRAVSVPGEAGWRLGSHEFGLAVVSRENACALLRSFCKVTIKTTKKPKRLPVMGEALQATIPSG